MFDIFPQKKKSFMLIHQEVCKNVITMTRSFPKIQKGEFERSTSKWHLVPFDLYKNDSQIYKNKNKKKKQKKKTNKKKKTKKKTKKTKKKNKKTKQVQQQQQEAQWTMIAHLSHRSFIRLSVILYLRLKSCKCVYSLPVLVISKFDQIL